jgi:hypothetical protein
MREMGNVTASRRHFLTGTAVVASASALVMVPAIPAFASPDAELLAMEPKVLVLYANYEDALAVFNRAERVFAEWRRRNPRPKFDMAERNRRVNAVKVDGEAAWQQAEHAYYCEAKANGTRWRGREELVRQQCGLTAAEEQKDSIEDAMLGACDVVAEFQATTLEGALFKARIAKLTEHADVAASIVDDLLAMQGGVA